MGYVGVHRNVYIFISVYSSANIEGFKEVIMIDRTSSPLRHLVMQLQSYFHFFPTTLKAETLKPRRSCLLATKSS